MDASAQVRSYRDLLVWRKSMDMVKHICEATNGFPRSEAYGLTEQIRRAAVSIPSNIAEGHARQHTKEFRQFLYIALGSLAELDTQLMIAASLVYMSEERRGEIEGELTEIRKMTSGLLTSLTGRARA